MKDEVKMIPIERIRIANPRHREKKRFEVIVESIKNLGLKKPIQVSVQPAVDGEPAGYNLVCGQGRMEALMALGHTEVPAIVVELTKEDRMLRSLVENIARRLPSPLALMNEIERLEQRGYSNVEIGKKLDIADTMIGGYLALRKAGEERLLDAAISGKIPLGVAMDIARAETPEMQRELLKGYESKQLNQLKIRTVRRLIDQRRFVSKERDRDPRNRKSKTNVESLVNAFKKESQRQKMLIKKARLCEAKLVFIETAFSQLLRDDNFVTLLRAEGLAQMPKHLNEKLVTRRKEAA